MKKIKLKERIMSLPLRKVVLVNIVLVSFFSLAIFTIINNNPNLKDNVVMQSMLLISCISSLCTSLLYHFDINQKWWNFLFRESIVGLIIAVVNLCTVYILLQFFITYINRSGHTIWADEAFSFPTVLLIMASFPIYIVFRIFFCYWRRINHLRRQHFSWALTYYFLVVVTLTIGFFLAVSFSGTLLLSKSSFQLTGSDFLGRSLDWLVLTFLPVSALAFAFILGAIMILIVPALLYSRFFTKKLTSRLDHLRTAAAALRNKVYTARSPVEGEDEIAQLQADFNNMAENLELSIEELNNEKRLVNDLLDERKELVASVSHELRTPITTIMNYLEAIQKRIKGKRDKELLHDIEIVSQEINRLNLIINDLFDLSRAEIGKLAIRKEACRIKDIVQQAVETYKPLAWKSRHVDLVSQVEDDLPDLMSDSNRLMQILGNLIRNAIQHTRPGGIVQVSAEKDGEQLALSITDTGEGISPEDLPHIWKRFYKGKQASSGNGIGLSVVKELVELMEGEIEVQSELGAGSQFRVLFPFPPSQ